MYYKMNYFKRDKIDGNWDITTKEMWSKIIKRA